MIYTVYFDGKRSLKLIELDKGEPHNLDELSLYILGLKLHGYLHELEVIPYILSSHGRYFNYKETSHKRGLSNIFSLHTPLESFISLCESQNINLKSDKEYLVVTVIKQTTSGKTWQ